MTIIVGIVADERITLACDSQTSADNTKRTDTSKISHLLFGAKNVLIAQAGDCTLSSRAVEIMQKEFLRMEFDDWRKPADAAQNAVKLLKQELVEINNWKDHREEEVEYLNLNPFKLMLAYFYEKIPFLYVLDSVPGFATRRYNYVAIGCGGNIGEYILSHANLKNMDLQQALITAIYTVEEVKRVDLFCGGPTRAAVISPTTVLMSETETTPLINSAVETLAAYETDLKAQWGSMIDDIIKKTSERYKNRKK